MTFCELEILDDKINNIQLHLISSKLLSYIRRILRRVRGVGGRIVLSGGSRPKMIAGNECPPSPWQPSFHPFCVIYQPGARIRSRTGSPERWKLLS